MSLQSGYKRLEYIQSSGKQWIDTGFKPNQDTRVVMNCYVISFNSCDMFIFGARVSAGNTAFYVAADDTNTKWFISYGSDVQNPVGTCTGHHSIDMNKNSVSIDDAITTLSASTFQSASNLLLFATNTAGSADSQRGTMNLYSCQIYDNGTLVRDYITCQTTSGEIGLWDDVNSVFYGNAGTGTFTAGPEVPKAPPTPSGFTSGRLTDTTVKLGWTASDGATGYKLYKNGALLATLTDTSYTDTVQIFSSTVYAVTAYNDDGESTAAELTYCSIPENPILYLVTDRTESDAAYVKLLSGKGLGGMSDAEKAEWLSGLKGSYNAPDLNRVESAVDYVAGRLQSFGNAVEVYPKKCWTTKDAPTVSAMKRYLNDVSALRAVLAVLPTTPEVPPDMDGLTYTEANDIEQILKDIDLLITNMTAAWFYSGDLYAGEV